jgi:hypothetical protein
MPALDRKRRTMRRSGYDTRAGTRTALANVLECERAGVHLDDTQTVAGYLIAWLDTKARRLKPTTVARYRDYLYNDLIPAFGAVRLERLTHQHVEHFVRTQLAAGRGLVTIRRCVTTLSSALNDAIRQRPLHRHTETRPGRTSMLDHRAGRHIPALLPPTRRPTHRTLRATHLHGHVQRRGLGLHWTDVDLKARLLFVRHTLVAVDNSHLVLNPPKTNGSRDWIALSNRAVNALRRRSRRHRAEAHTGPAYHNRDLVFCRSNGLPLGPSTSYATSTTWPKRRAFPASASTTCGTSPPPS